MLVCPDCGNGEFRATLTTRTEYIYEVYDGGALLKRSSTVVDGGDEDAIETFDCIECGAMQDPRDLITEEAYASAEADDDA